MRKIAGLLCSIFIAGGCAVPVDIPSLPKEHPAQGFYQTANTSHVSASECSKLRGSLGIRPDKIGLSGDYEKSKELAPGLFIVRQKSTGKEFVTVLFMEYGLVASMPRTCSWATADYPIEETQKTNIELKTK